MRHSKKQTGKVSSGLFWNEKTGRYERESVQTITVSRKPIKSQPDKERVVFSVKETSGETIETFDIPQSARDLVPIGTSKFIPMEMDTLSVNQSISIRVKNNRETLDNVWGFILRHNLTWRVAQSAYWQGDEEPKRFIPGETKKNLLRQSVNEDHGPDGKPIFAQAKEVYIHFVFGRNSELLQDVWDALHRRAWVLEIVLVENRLPGNTSCAHRLGDRLKHDKTRRGKDYIPSGLNGPHNSQIRNRH